MASFKDLTGKVHDLRMTVASARRVRDRTGLDLMKLMDPDAAVLTKLSEDPLLVFDVIAAMLDADANELGEALDEAALEAAGNALIEAVLDFFPAWKSRPLREIQTRTEAAMVKRRATAEREMATLTETLDVDALLQKHLTSSASAGGSPASSELTPTPEPSAS